MQILLINRQLFSVSVASNFVFPDANTNIGKSDKFALIGAFIMLYFFCAVAIFGSADLNFLMKVCLDMFK